MEIVDASKEASAFYTEFSWEFFHVLNDKLWLQMRLGPWKVGLLFYYQVVRVNCL